MDPRAVTAPGITTPLCGEQGSLRTAEGAHRAPGIWPSRILRLACKCFDRAATGRRPFPLRKAWSHARHRVACIVHQAGSPLPHRRHRSLSAGAVRVHCKSWTRASKGLSKPLYETHRPLPATSAQAPRQETRCTTHSVGVESSETSHIVDCDVRGNANHIRLSGCRRTVRTLRARLTVSEQSPGRLKLRRACCGNPYGKRKGKSRNRSRTTNSSAGGRAFRRVILLRGD